MLKNRPVPSQPARAGEARCDSAQVVQRRFEALVNSIDGIVWEADPITFRFSFVSAQAERILGYRTQEWYAEGFWAAHIYPDDRERALRYCAAQTKSGVNHTFEYRMLASNGAVVWLKDSVSVEVCNGQPVSLRGIMMDITEHKRAEEALRLSATVFENSEEGIAIIDADQRFLEVNRAFCAITGYAKEDVVGKKHPLMPSDQEAAAVFQAIWKAVDEQDYWSGEVRAFRKSGEEFIAQLSMRLVRDADGKVANYIAIFSDVSRARAAQAEIERLSYFDALTGLPNRALLNDRLQHALLKAEHHHYRVALLAIDVDRLAHINEVLGHQIGDRLLAAVAERLRALMGDADTVSRHVGDEFTAVLEELDDTQAAVSRAEQVLGELERNFILDGHEVRISASIGISIYPEDGKTPELLLQHADVALHHAKNSGESRIQFFREEMNRASVERMQLESNLRMALQRHEFRVLYQPQVEFDSGCITGMEALVRWQHPQMGLVLPARFIPIAEETSHIVEIGLWVLHEACVQTRRWHELGYPHLQVAVNVSARQLRQADFSARVKQVLNETRLPPDRLELELTESMIMQRPEYVIGVMSELRALGVKFSIDDFGTGYSSLSQLKRFPLDTLKIDKSFTHDIGKGEYGSAITRAIIALGNNMRLRVVAEGVETTDQQRFLRDSECQCMQGYLFSPPVDATQFSELLKKCMPAATAG
ncbi:MAG TPA: EAL domain-containing protein [Noviherbaspirillum sp.]|nr:EAL domain-containing protein [Noviherbaspirillum sp.]